MDKNTTPTLCEWAGGPETIRHLFKTFYARVPSNKILEPVFRHMDQAHAETVGDFVCEVLGRPKNYSEQNGHSHASMVAKHIGKHLTEEQRAEWMRALLETADDLNLPDDPEFRSALVAYLEWGSRIAKNNSSLQNNPIDSSEPMPTWGWGEPKGPYIP